MRPSFLAIRAIGAEFANRIYFPVVIIAAIVAAVLIALVVWLTTMNSWWLLLGIPLTILLSVAAAVAIVVKLVIRSVTPSQTKPQKKATKQFVDKLQRLSETAQTPAPVLLFRIVRDIAAPRENGFIGTLSHDSTSLKKDFSDLGQSFKS